MANYGSRWNISLSLWVWGVFGLIYFISGLLYIYMWTTGYITTHLQDWNFPVNSKIQGDKQWQRHNFQIVSYFCKTASMASFFCGWFSRFHPSQPRWKIHIWLIESPPHLTASLSFLVAFGCQLPGSNSPFFHWQTCRTAMALGTQSPKPIP